MHTDRNYKKIAYNNIIVSTKLIDRDCYETRIFHGSDEGRITKARTFIEAMENHQEAVQLAKRGI
jgi:hypothetical protein